MNLTHTENDIKNKIIKLLNISSNDLINYQINKKAIDARKKDNIHYVYEIDVNVKNEDRILNKNKSNDILKAPLENYSFNISGTKKQINRPVIVGSGPAGLFAAYMLSTYGFNPILIELGIEIA